MPARSGTEHFYPRVFRSFFYLLMIEFGQGWSSRGFGAPFVGTGSSSSFESWDRNWVWPVAWLWDRSRHRGGTRITPVTFQYNQSLLECSHSASRHRMILGSMLWWAPLLTFFFGKHGMRFWFGRALIYIENMLGGRGQDVSWLQYLLALLETGLLLCPSFVSLRLARHFLWLHDIFP